MQLDCTVTAPAKINLSLRICGRRADGYHEIDSLFVPLSLADRLHIRADSAEVTSVRCDCPAAPQLDGDDNLAARAARLLLQRSGVRAKVDISIDKQIWQAAGLGGGSSDAAAVLRALGPALGDAQPDAPSLAALALELGADVPFFLDPRPMRARGIGDQLAAVHGIPQLHLVLANPALPLSTAAVYRGLDLTPGTNRSVPEQPERVEPTLAALSALMTNDLEPVAKGICPRIEDLEQSLVAAGAVAASMSGSGPTVFGVFADEAAARRALDIIRKIPDTYSTYCTSVDGLT